MNEVVEFLRANPVQYLATVGEDGRPKCRPFMFATDFDGKLWFCTASTKLVSKELKANPYLELSVSAPDFSWCRISARACFEQNRQVKELCLEIPIVKSIYEVADNPIFEVFYLSEGSAVIADFSGEPPRTYQL